MNGNPRFEPCVGIVILTCNQRGLTLDCLHSLFQMEYKNWFIVLVDNASTDGTAQAVRDKFPGVRIIVNSANLGVAGGRNVGAIFVLEQGVDYILFLDNDTLVDPEFLKELVKVVESDSTVGAIGPKIYYFGYPLLLCHAIGVFYPYIYQHRSLGGNKIDVGQFNCLSKVDWISGCAGLYNTHIFKKVGLFDEIFSPYGPEDVDFSLRITKAGYRLAFSPEAHIYHRVNPHQSAPREKVRNIVRGRILLIRKHAQYFDVFIGLGWLVFYYLFYVPFRRKIKRTNLVMCDYLPGVLSGLRDGLFQVRGG